MLMSTFHKGLIICIDMLERQVGRQMREIAGEKQMCNPLNWTTTYFFVIAFQNKLHE